MFEGKPWNFTHIYSQSTVLLEEFHHSNIKGKINASHPFKCWSLLSTGQLKVNINVVISMIDSKLGFNYIIRDAYGQVFGAMIDNMVASFTSLAVELHAI